MSWNREPSMITRRIFVRNSALAVVGTAAVPSFLTRAAFGAVDPRGRTKRLVVIFQRGAADGLNIVVPHGEQQYYAMRPSINIPRKSVIDLDGFFGLHPALSPFLPLWQQKHPRQNIARLILRDMKRRISRESYYSLEYVHLSHFFQREFWSLKAHQIRLF